MSWDPDLDLEHGVLRNRLRITDPDALAAAEATYTALRILQIERDPIPGRYDLAHLQAFHGTIAGDVYPFGGQLRSVRLGKGGQPFCPPEQITDHASVIFDRRSDPARLRASGCAQILAELTSLMADMIWLHPFREVNGRAIRTFLTQLSADSGWRLRWDDLDRDRNRVAAAAPPILTVVSKAPDRDTVARPRSAPSPGRRPSDPPARGPAQAPVLSREGNHLR